MTQSQPLVENQNQTEAACSAIRSNINAVVKLEESSYRNRSFGDRVSDAIGGFSGSLSFVALHAVVYGLWILINLGWIPQAPRFDAYPFMLLSVVVSLEAIFLSTFVLIKQNRMSRRADQRDHLDLQINLLAEKEMTIMLQMLQRISARLGVRHEGEEIEELSEETSVEALARELHQKLPRE
jgi:uncharacterized membrane protein